MGASILNGLAAGPAETLQPAVITDIFFLHERGFYQTLYFCFYVGGIMAGPVLAGPMSQYAGWRNYWWLNVAMHAATILACLVLFPETKWEGRARGRESTVKDAQSLEAQFEQKAVLSNEEKPSTKEAGTTSEQSPVSSTNDVDDPYLRKGKPSKASFGFYQLSENPWMSILLDLWVPWKLFAFPIVQFASFVVSWSLSNFLIVNLTQSQFLEPPPYNFSPLAVGLSNFALLVGAVIGLLTAGPLSDWLSMALTKRNQGIREPEMRLPTNKTYLLKMILIYLKQTFG